MGRTPAGFAPKLHVTLSTRAVTLRQGTSETGAQASACYGAGTRVGVHRSRYELERVLGRHGASDVAFVELETNASIQFALQGRYVQMALPLPEATAERFTHTPSGRPRTLVAQERAYEQALRETEAELRTRSVPVYAAVCDVANAEALDRFLDAARDELGAVDILVNNPSALSLADDETAWQSTLNVDLMAAVRASWKVAPWMAGAGGGAIVHISSIAGLEATGFPPAYCAAKAALISHAKSLAVALAPQKIRVNSVAPGSIEFAGGLWAAASLHKAAASLSRLSR